jgi:transposase
MWTTENRPRYNRDKLRYPSDLTDEEWALVEPLIPPAKHGGRRRWVVVREVNRSGFCRRRVGLSHAAKAISCNWA